MGTRLWGPDTWYVIHVIADSASDTLTEAEQASYRTFYESLADVLPCPSCAVHYKQFLKKDPPVFKTRVEMIQWTIRAHNHANTNTGAPVLTEDEAFHRIEQEIKARENGIVRGRIPTLYETCTDTAVPVIVTAGVIMILIYLFRQLK